jgi:hypothetical protein
MTDAAVPIEPVIKSRLPLSQFLRPFDQVFRKLFEPPPKHQPSEIPTLEPHLDERSNEGVNLSRIQAGHEFEAEVISELYYALEGFKTVTLYYANGDLVTPENFNQKTQGTDLIIEIEAANDRAARQVAGRVKKVVEELGNAESPNL